MPWRNRERFDRQRAERNERIRESREAFYQTVAGQSIRTLFSELEVGIAREKRAKYEREKTARERLGGGDWKRMEDRIYRLMNGENLEESPFSLPVRPAWDADIDGTEQTLPIAPNHGN